MAHYNTQWSHDKPIIYGRIYVYAYGTRTGDIIQFVQTHHNESMCSFCSHKITNKSAFPVPVNN
jgi:hypothetical protein